MSREVKIRAIRSDGQVFEYTGDDWGIKELKGVDFPEIQIYKKNRGYGNGSIITGKRKEARQIEIKAREENPLNIITDRAKAIGFHNSNYTFDLHITYLGVTRIAKECQLEHAQLPTGNVWRRLNLEVTYLHPESDLLGEGKDSTNFVATLPMWHVTRAYKQGEKLAFGAIKHESDKVINYLGSEDTFIKVVVEATGLVENINLAVNSVVFKVTVTLKAGDTLTVDSEFKTVKHNGTDVPPGLYTGETIGQMLLKYGDNNVSVYADDRGNTAYNAEVSYIGRFGGL